MKKLLIPATTVPLARGDGTPSFVLDLAVRLTAHFDVTVLAPRVPGSQPVDEIEGVTVRRFAYFPRPFEQLAADAIMPRLRSQPWRILEALALITSMALHTLRFSRGNRCDVINAHWILPAGLAAMAARMVNRKPYVLTVHGADVYSLRGRVARLVKSSILARASVVLPVSSEIEAMVSVMARPGRVNVHRPVPMGVERQAVSNEPRKLGDLLVVGRLADKKGFDVAIKAVAGVPDVRLRIAGDGPEQASLRELVRSLDIEPRVDLLGRLTRDSVLDEMRTCGCLLIPSKVGSGGDQEGTPVVLAEAMSLGTPVIASDISGLRDYVVDGETGWLISPDDVGALMSVLSRFVANPVEALEMGRRARTSFAGSDLDIETTVDAYRKTITEVVA